MSPPPTDRAATGPVSTALTDEGPRPAPVRQPPAPVVRRLRTRAAKGAWAGKLHPRLLIVDPREFTADVIATALTPLDLECHHATGAWDAARWLSERPSPTLMVVDPAAPDALGLLGFARGLWPEFPAVVAFTAPDERREDEAVWLGAAAVLVYPCPADELRAAVAGALTTTRDLPAPVPGPLPRPERLAGAGPAGSNPRPVRPLREAVRDYERRQIARALRRHEGKRGDTARALGVERTTLYKLMRRHGFAPGPGEPDGPPCPVPARQAPGRPSKGGVSSKTPTGRGSSSFPSSQRL